MANGGKEARIRGGTCVEPLSSTMLGTEGTEAELPDRSQDEGTLLIRSASEIEFCKCIAAASNALREDVRTAVLKGVVRRERKSSPIRLNDWEQYVNWVKRDVRDVASSTWGRCVSSRCNRMSILSCAKSKRNCRSLRAS